MEQERTKYRPGPWKMRSDTLEIVAADSDDWRRIGQCSIWGGIGWEEARANARLMVAAPEMLEALDNLVGPGAQHENTCDSIEHDDASPCIWCQARTAIAKAEGRDA